jgi:hypothetical protein
MTVFFIVWKFRVINFDEILRRLIGFQLKGMTNF